MFDARFACSALEADEHRMSFEPDGCKLSTFGHGQLLYLLQNRTIVFIGDSTVRAQARHLICALWFALGSPSMDSSQGSVEEGLIMSHIRAVPEEHQVVEGTERSFCTHFVQGSQIVCWVSAGKCCFRGVEEGDSEDHICLGACLRQLEDAQERVAGFLTVNDVRIYFKLHATSCLLQQRILALVLHAYVCGRAYI